MGATLAMAALLAACSGAPAGSAGATAAGTAGRTSAGTVTGTAPVSQGTGAPIDPNDPEAVLTAAIDGMAALDSWSFTMRVETGSGSARAGTVDVGGTIRRKPVAAEKFVVSGGGVTNTWIAVGDKGWFHTEPGPAGYTDSTAKDVERQNSDFLFSAVSSPLQDQLDKYELAGDETSGGVAVRHYTLNAAQRARQADLLGIKAEDIRADIWTTPDSGRLFRVVWGQAGADGQISTYDVTETNCTCPVEPPA